MRKWLKLRLRIWLGVEVDLAKLHARMTAAEATLAFESDALKREAELCRKKCDELVVALKIQAGKRATPRYADFEMSQSEVLSEFELMKGREN